MTDNNPIRTWENNTTRPWDEDELMKFNGWSVVYSHCPVTDEVFVHLPGMYRKSPRALPLKRARSLGIVEMPKRVRRETLVERKNNGKARGRSLE